MKIDPTGPSVDSQVGVSFVNLKLEIIFLYYKTKELDLLL